jgi:DNA-binding beta-propeller fold protein YncE
MQVINVKTGKPEELDPVGITEGLASGTHIPAAGQGVLFNPEGNLVFVPGEDVAENVYKYGYKADKGRTGFHLRH